MSLSLDNKKYTTVKSIIEKEGMCEHINCDMCPFSPLHNFGIDCVMSGYKRCYNRDRHDKTLVKSCNAYVNVYECFCK